MPEEARRGGQENAEEGEERERRDGERVAVEEGEKVRGGEGREEAEEGRRRGGRERRGVDGEGERDLGRRDEEGIGLAPWRGLERRPRRGVPWGRHRRRGVSGRRPALDGAGADGSAHCESVITGRGGQGRREQSAKFKEVSLPAVHGAENRLKIKYMHIGIQLVNLHGNFTIIGK